MNLRSVHKYTLVGELENLVGVKKVLKLQKRGVKKFQTPKKGGGVKSFKFQGGVKKFEHS